MARRFALLVAALSILIISLMSAVPVFAYGHANDYHLRLSRLDRITCDKKIGIKAELTTNGDDPVKGVSIHFAIARGAPNDKVSPADVVTDRRGEAVTYVTLDCRKVSHQVLATAIGKASARITLVTDPGQGHDGHDDHYGPPPSHDFDCFTPWVRQAFMRLTQGSAFAR